MKWNEIKRGIYSSVFVLEDYPFFYATFEGNKFGGYESGYMFRYPRQKFKTIEEAKSFCQDWIYKNLPKYEDIQSIEQFVNNPMIRISYTTWCNNNGDGKYIHDGLYQKYHWLEGKPLETTCTAHSYAIRYTREVPESFVKSQGVKILKRHVRRFLREYYVINGLNKNICV